MDDSLLSLKWNNHISTFCDVLTVIRNKGKYADCTLAVDGHFYQAHKLVLSMCSDYMSDIFDHVTAKSPVIVLKDIRSQDLEFLLDYMYLGNVNVSQSDLPFLLRAAEHLKIKGLAAPDIGTLTKQLERDNEKLGHFKRKRSESPIDFQVQSKIQKCHSYPKKQTVLQKQPFNAKIKIEDDELGAVNPSQLYEASSSNKEIENDNSIADSQSVIFAQSQVDVAYDESYESNSEGVGQQATGNLDDCNTSETSSLPNLVSPSSIPQLIDNKRCSLCQVKLANPNLLRRHVEDHHFHIRKFICKNCGKKFKRKEHLDRHNRIHTGEKPFECEICYTRFTQKEHLKGHIENVHNKHKDKGRDCKDQDSDQDSSPSLASPSAIASFMDRLAPHFNYLPNPPINALSHMSPVVHSDTALFAQRQNANSPNKQVQTITIDFN